MPRINLLPWRAELRQQRKKEFLVALLGAAIAGGVLVYGSKLMVGGWISNQVQRNTILKNEIAQLDKQIEEIKGLESQRERLVARMKVIGELQRSRPEIVHLFDEIVRQLPEGVYLTSVKQTNKRLKFDGVAQSSTRVSAFMRNIDGSEWLRNPDLEVVETRNGQTTGSNFTLFAEQVSNAAADTNSGGKGKPGAKVMASRGAR